MLIDLESLEEWANGDIATMKEIIHLFEENTPPTLQLLNQAIASENWEEIARHAHKLKSSYGIVVIGNSLELVQAIQECGLQKTNLDLVKKDFASLEEQFEAAKSEFADFKEKNPT